MKINLIIIILLFFSVLACDQVPFNSRSGDDEKFVWYPIGKGEITSVHYDGMRCMAYHYDGGSSISCIKDFQ